MALCMPFTCGSRMICWTNCWDSLLSKLCSVAVRCLVEMWGHIARHHFILLVSGSRLETLWHDELKRRGREGASLTRVFWRFCQTRMLVAIFSLLLTMVAGFVGPVSTVQILLFLYVLLIRLIWFSMVATVGVLSPGVFFLKIALSHFTLVWKLKWHHTGRLQSLW